ncbi:hypothetical protein N9L26_00680 [Candidatus Pacebacteria bacterium]|nr:hypothetical protein [Candidatus Paceibacterota bacterium]
MNHTQSLMDFLSEHYGTILSLHIAAVVITLATVVIADSYGLLWLSGKKDTLDERRLALFHRLVWVGLGITAVAGALMFVQYPGYLLSSAGFQVKLFFILALSINALLIGKHLKLATEQPFATLPTREKVTLILSGLVSTTAWVGALIAAQFIGLS